MRSCGCGYSCRFSSSPYSSAGGWGGGVCSSFLSILLRFLMVQIYVTSSLQFWNQVIFYHCLAVII